jgi:hypothetical protein
MNVNTNRKRKETVTSSDNKYQGCPDSCPNVLTTARESSQCKSHSTLMSLISKLYVQPAKVKSKIATMSIQKNLLKKNHQFLKKLMMDWAKSVHSSRRWQPRSSIMFMRRRLELPLALVIVSSRWNSREVAANPSDIIVPCTIVTIRTLITRQMSIRST